MRFQILVTIMLVTFLFALPVNANSVTITSTTFDIVAGDSIDINFTIDYTDSIDTTCYVSISISPDDIGISLTYNPSFILKSQTSTLYYIHVDTSISLVPGNYTLTTTFQIEGAEPIIRHTVRHSSQGNVVPIQPIDETHPPEENETIPPIIILPPDFGGNQFNWWWVILLIIIIIGIILLFFYLRKRSKRT